jgi:hypothetical protein
MNMTRHDLHCALSLKHITPSEHPVRHPSQRMGLSGSGFGRAMCGQDPVPLRNLQLGEVGSRELQLVFR